MSHYYIQPPTKEEARAKWEAHQKALYEASERRPLAYEGESDEEVARIERWDYATRKEYGIA